VDARELEGIYSRYRQALFTLALSRTGHREQAEDAVHEAFVRLCRLGLGQSSDPVSYVFSAVRNAAIDQVRRMHIAGGNGGNGSLPESIFDFRCGRAEERAISAERAELIAGAMGCLSAEQREALVLRIFGGLSFAQIAQVVGAPLPTVASRYQRALERLRERLEKLV
jgi:RNA polymerase sigma-70 factor (ECF subfamily)